MTLEDAASVLKQHYSDIGDPYMQKKNPWDRGYLEGRRDGLELAYQLLRRVQAVNRG